jgi:hypothetical protein
LVCAKENESTEKEKTKRKIKNFIKLGLVKIFFDIN